MFLYLKFFLNWVLPVFVLFLIPDAGSGVEEVELNWEDYLEETGSTAVPYGSFKHVSDDYIAWLTIFLFFDSLHHQ